MRAVKGGFFHDLAAIAVFAPVASLSDHWLDSDRERYMAEQTVASDATTRAYNRAQLHGEACIDCGRDDCELLAAGHRRIENRPGQVLSWAVVACPEHRSVA